MKLTVTITTEKPMRLILAIFLALKLLS